MNYFWGLLFFLFFSFLELCCNSHVFCSVGGDVLANRGPSDARELIKPSYIVAENVTFRSSCEFPCTTTDRVRAYVCVCVCARAHGWTWETCRIGYESSVQQTFFIFLSQMSVIKSALPETGRGEKAERRERISVLAGGGKRWPSCPVTFCWQAAASSRLLAEPYIWARKSKRHRARLTIKKMERTHWRKSHWHS